MTDKPTLVPGGRPAEPYHRLSAEGLTYPERLRELVESRGENQTLSVWAALDPAGFKRLFDFIDPHFAPENGVLPVPERRLVAVVVSAENRCTGCILLNERRFAAEIGDAERARRISINYRSVQLSRRERAIADFAVRMTQAPYTVDNAAIEDLRTVGLQEKEIMEVIQIGALVNMTNRLSTAIGSRPDPDFFLQPSS
jgi:uncharacterized peroxidase-related enzyme